MPITRRKRRRILQALLPVLAFVWATLPGLPCCHELGDVTSDETAVAAISEHNGHHQGPAVAEGFAVDHGANHCEEGSVADTDPPCTDIQKTSNDLRPVYFAAPLAVVANLLPAIDATSVHSTPLPDPSPPPRYRPLHLEKSVLLI